MNAKEAKNLSLINSNYEIEMIENCILEACNNGKTKTIVDIIYMTDKAKNYLRINEYNVVKITLLSNEHYEITWE